MNNRQIVIDRVKKEIIGPGSDIFECQDIKNEIIGDKPLKRYFSGILYPKVNNNENNEIKEYDDIDEDLPDKKEDEEGNQQIEQLENSNYNETTNQNNENDEFVTNNTFYPSQMGLSFTLKKDCEKFKIILNFGNYKKAKNDEVALKYDGNDIHLLNKFLLDQYVYFDENKKLLYLKKIYTKTDKKKRDEDLKNFRKEYNQHILFKIITKLFFKDKYKRYDNFIPIEIQLEDIFKETNKYLKIKIADYVKNTNNWWEGKLKKEDESSKKLKDYIFLHIKVFEKNEQQDKYFVKVLLDNQLPLPKNKLSVGNENFNQICFFQTEIKIESNNLLPFNSYKNAHFKSDEDKMLDFLFKHKKNFGIGHNTACIWENHEKDDFNPTWVSTNYLPEYNVQSQSTKIKSIDNEKMYIKNFTDFNENNKSIFEGLEDLKEKYNNWIDLSKNTTDEFELKNISKCRKIYNRIDNAIKLLHSNEHALKAFKLANTAIYLQMFQNELHFENKKQGFELYEDNIGQLKYTDYKTENFPNNKIPPSWRPFQLAFILQTLPSFIEENCDDRDLVDLLYFPTGGGKTEAYLAVAAFLIFWRRLNYPNQYDGVNIIVRYTLRLLSAQQFERATKLILACEFIRQNNNLGNSKITIGFWVGNSTIPNKIEDAKKKLKDLQDLLNNNKENKTFYNPFQISNCQWCNTKMISKININEKNTIGHRINNDGLKIFCLNENCNFCTNKGGLPIVLIDVDIYKHPPTMLFGTVDKFARLAWEGAATKLFNNGNNRKPELIIQDELHLLNGPLGSLVALYENVILKLCTNNKIKPKIIVSTATVKNVELQISALYNREVSIFPQPITNAEDSFFSIIENSSKRKYIGILPTGKTIVLTNLRLKAALLFARLEIFLNQENADQFWTILSYFKNLKDLGRFSNKINDEMKNEIKQLQVRNLKYQLQVRNLKYQYYKNYSRLSYNSIELTSRISNEKIKKNLDDLKTTFNNDLDNYQAKDIILASNMISAGLDVGRLNLFIMNGMPPNIAEYIQATSRVARKDEGLIFTLNDANNSRDLSFFEDFIPFHKSFYKNVEPISITPFAETALDKMLFTVIVTYFRHIIGDPSNESANALTINDNKKKLLIELDALIKDNKFMDEEDKSMFKNKIDNIIEAWKNKIESTEINTLYYFGCNQEKKNLMKPLESKQNDDEILIAMQSMRSVEAEVKIFIQNY